uniref:F-box domain-containing protein n=1 Tax=Oryza punctata TaxID=4537 RepID=A0A0E0M5N6_ORYPU
MPYTGGWLSRRRCLQRGRNYGGGGELLTALPDDVLLEMLLGVFSDAADVARFASTCPLWGSYVATHASTISRALPRPARFIPHIALGFFHQENGVSRCPRGRTRLVASTSAQPRFFPAASASRFLGPFTAGSARLPDGEALFAYAQPVASRNGRVVFELRREARSDGVTLVVSNPMTGDIAVLPSLSGEDCPGSYTCAILTGEDLDAPPRSTHHHLFFRLLIIYNRRSFTAMRCYSSDAGSWGSERRKPGGKILDHRLRRLGHGVVVGGVAYWPLHREAFGVRLSDSTMDVCSVPYMCGGYWPDFRLLGVSPDGKNLRYITLGFVGRVSLCVSLMASQFEDVDEKIHDVHVRVPGLRVTTVTPIKLRWFGEKSGTLLFTIGDADGGVFALNMAERTVEKLADGGGYHACRNIYGYEMDRTALFASLAD